MKKLLICAGIAVATFASGASALAAEGSSCHFHGNTPTNDKVAADCAAQRKASLISGGKLDKSWEAVKVDKVEQVDGKKGKEWRVSFKNGAVSDADKSTLYVFLSLPGNYIASNFTGR
ncbi:MAG: hypothetical protein DI563_05235 [Variovorax paradoxus]|uniref:Lipoprotein n=1 Tax=Variovorax paradoxus TaxID=34073 RepID=A0A2W5QIU8_VARPD|nr:MAG: hypothetical protein DI563_05235 [Variovorax paradoxus]